MNERWMFIYQGMQAWSSVVQAVIAVIALIAGLGYLNQHKRKIKIEKNVELAEKIIQGLYQISEMIEQYFKGIDDYAVKEYLKNNKNAEIHQEYVESYARIAIINKNIAKKSDEINFIYSQVSTFTDFLKDQNTRKLLSQLKKYHAGIIDNLFWLESTIKFESELVIYLSNEELIKKKFDFESKTTDLKFGQNFEPLNYFRLKLQEIKEFIIENHIP